MADGLLPLEHTQGQGSQSQTKLSPDDLCRVLVLKRDVQERGVQLLP